MSVLGSYRVSFFLALNTQLAYRVNFVIGRMRDFLVYGALLLLYVALPQGSGDYSQAELLTYVLISSLFSSTAFVYGMHTIADEINFGDLTNYLLRPINYFGYWISRLAAERSLLLIGGGLQVLFLLWLFSSSSFIFQTNVWHLFQTVVLFIGSIVLIQTLDFIGGLFSFWTNKGHGPRWLITIFIQFLSGSYLPLDTLPDPVRAVLAWTPFPSVIFAPLQAYLGRMDTSAWLISVLVQWFWIGIMTLILRVLWRKGLRVYGAYGR